MLENIKNVCEEKVFKELYLKYANELKQFLYFKFGDLATAEDFVQDAYISLWNNCQKIVFNKAKNYLFTVVNNAFINAKKHQQIVYKHQEKVKKIAHHSTGETPEYLLQEKEFYEKLKSAIDNLKDKQKEVFLLSRIEKLTYKKIAEKLNISVKVVEKRMHNALVILREKIGNV